MNNNRCSLSGPSQSAKACVNGESATHHSDGSQRLSEFFPQTLTDLHAKRLNRSNDLFSRKDVPFAVKVATFHTP